MSFRGRSGWKLGGGGSPPLSSRFMKGDGIPLTPASGPLLPWNDFLDEVLERFTPVRRISPFVAGKRFDAVNPARERRIVAFHGQEARSQFRRGAAVQGTA